VGRADEAPRLHALRRQGGDRGSIAARWRARGYRLARNLHQFAGDSAFEAAAVLAADHYRRNVREGARAIVPSTCEERNRRTSRCDGSPQTAGYGATDLPAGLAAWILCILVSVAAWGRSQTSPTKDDAG
jgi:hypothetical protein